MDTISKELSKIIGTAFKSAGYFLPECKVLKCVVEGFGDFQCNDAMQIAKEYKKAPFIIADDVVKCIPKNDIIEKCYVVKPGFINIVINNYYLSEYITKYIENLDANVKSLLESKKNIIVDYGGANVAKPLHIGHLRSAIIGESVKRICAYLGNKTIGDVHLGDWGLQMGMIISEIKLQKPNLVYFDDSFSGEYPKQSPVTIEDLSIIYPTASARAKSDENFMNEARKATFELQNGKKGYVELWKKFMEVSLVDLKKNYDSLNVHFDLWLGESDSNKYCWDMIETLKKDGFAYESEGAYVIDVSEENDKVEIPPFMLVKTDGSILYSTTDLATIILREKEYDVDKIIYLADNRQSLHFTQLFRCAKKTKLLSKNIELNFAGFGTMNGKDGKPYKTRDGGVMKLSNLIEEVKQKALEKVKVARGQNLTDEEMLNISDVVALASLKFADLSNYRTKDYIFDLDKFCSFEGKTGPYILYTVTRIKSLLKKCGEKSLKEYKLNIYSDIEREILIHLSQFDSYLMSAYNDFAPSYLCDYAYNLANLFSTFYSKFNISKEQDDIKQGSWMKLSNYCLKILEIILDLLAIKTLDKM